MMKEELGLTPVEGSPVAAGLVVGFSYIIAAAIPLAPYMFLAGTQALILSVLLTGGALFGVGIGKARLTQRPQLRSGIETLAAGLIGTLACYGIGQLGAHFLGHG
jgi:predicted membrane protein (TIGR00267 family)